MCWNGPYLPCRQADPTFCAAHVHVNHYIYPLQVRTTALHIDEQRKQVPPVGDRPPFLPTAISDRMCTNEQAEWWITAYKLFKNIAK